ncbi:MAG TPA: hypothetical protein VEL75_09190 [Candidatus Methylomirabilis sp.]|nr:hypothetical protein [Candidatus Methylomirabilis sp.]
MLHPEIFTDSPGRPAVEGLSQSDQQQDARNGGQQADERFLDGHSICPRIAASVPTVPNPTTPSET